MARGVNASEMTNEFAEDTHTYRGVTYVLRELPMDEYDKLVKLATAEKIVDGETTEEFDSALHTKLLTAKSIVSPKLSQAELYGKGTRLVRALQGKVLALHLDPEPEDKAKAAEDDDAGEAPAPAPASE